MTECLCFLGQELVNKLLIGGEMTRLFELRSAAGVNLAMLVIHLYCCLSSVSVSQRLHPLTEILTEPHQAAVSYILYLVMCNTSLLYRIGFLKESFTRLRNSLGLCFTKNHFLLNVLKW